MAKFRFIQIISSCLNTPTILNFAHSRLLLVGLHIFINLARRVNFKWPDKIKIRDGTLTEIVPELQAPK